jgi:predicted acylesterase/phospholipase RssA
VDGGLSNPNPVSVLPGAVADLIIAINLDPSLRRVLGHPPAAFQCKAAKANPPLPPEEGSAAQRNVGLAGSRPAIGCESWHAEQRNDQSQRSHCYPIRVVMPEHRPADVSGVGKRKPDTLRQW